MAKTKQSTNARLGEALAAQVAHNDATVAALVAQRVAEQLAGAVLIPHALRGDYQAAQVQVKSKGLRTVTEEQTFEPVAVESAYRILLDSVQAQASAEGASLSLIYSILSDAPITFGDDWQQVAKDLTKIIGEKIKADRPDDYRLITQADTFRQVRAKATKAVAFTHDVGCMLGNDGNLRGRVALSALVPKQQPDDTKAVAKALELLAECDVELIAGSVDALGALQNIARAIGTQRAIDGINLVQSAVRSAAAVMERISTPTLVPARNFDGTLEAITLHNKVDQYTRTPDFAGLHQID